MANTITMLARMKDKPELRKTTSGTSVITFAVACNRNFSDGTDWFDVTCWKQKAEYSAQYGDKGRSIYISGTLQTRSYEDKNGIKRKAYEIIADNVAFADSRRTSEDSSEVEPETEQPAIIDTAEDLPF